MGTVPVSSCAGGTLGCPAAFVTPMRIPLLLALLLPFAAAAASDYVDIEQRLTAEQRRATGLDTLSPEQLQLLNRLLREQSPADTQAASAAPATLPRAAEPHANQVGLDDAPIAARLRGTVAGWEPGTVFELDNGQQWKVLKGSARLPQPLESPAVTVTPGLVGRWFLQVSEDLPKARVYRVD